MSDAINDNGSRSLTQIEPPDAHGRAALLLVESLLHGLVVRSGLSTLEAVEIVQRAIDVQNDINDDGANKPPIKSAAMLLTAIGSSLRIDN